MVKSAKDECSKNKRCVGIESFFDYYDEETYFKLCLDSIYRSTAWDKYEESKNQILKKAESQCKFTTHDSLQPTITWSLTLYDKYQILKNITPLIF